MTKIVLPSGVRCAGASQTPSAPEEPPQVPPRAPYRRTYPPSSSPSVDVDDGASSPSPTSPGSAASIMQFVTSVYAPSSVWIHSRPGLAQLNHSHPDSRSRCVVETRDVDRSLIRRRPTREQEHIPGERRRIDTASGFSKPNDMAVRMAPSDSCLWSSYHCKSAVGGIRLVSGRLAALVLVSVTYTRHWLITRAPFRSIHLSWRRRHRRQASVTTTSA